MSDPKDESEASRKARRGRSLAIAGGLLLFVILVYAVTISRLGANVLDRTF